MPQSVSLAIVATACRFPDAHSPAELWANVSEGRRSFRPVPRQRLDLARYAVAAIGEADSITPIRAGLLANWRPDPARLRIPRKTFEATDLTHWLALEIAAEAFDAIGGADRLDRARTAVVVANTLTGEFSRAALMRLRLPFLDDVLTEAATREGVDDEALARLRQRFAGSLRQYFAEPNEDSLAGGLANTIAGRIANHFDLHGGAYSVDGACASSLLALADAGNLIVSGQADAVLVAAVDLSLDPFEMVGFSRNGALAKDEMRVFDARANGFWPGEGGGCVLLVRGDDATRRELPVLARLRGWGISSDGAGGLTRPSSDGQSAAYRRAYMMAGVDPADIAFVEAHGTGTAIGDPTEVRALAALHDGAPSSLPIGSIKANIGHTKAAAGLAGLIKSIEALRHNVVPPHVGCDTPHPVFAEVDGRVHPALAGELIDDARPAVAGVSSFGFGGINAHVVIERSSSSTVRAAPRARPLTQDAELFVFAGVDAAGIMAALSRLEQRAASLSIAELVDVAAYTSTTLRPGPIRVALVARDGDELAVRLARAKAALVANETVNDGENGVFVSRAERTPRIAFLFPGQAAPSRSDGGAWARRFTDSNILLQQPINNGNAVATDIAQPSIIAASLVALRLLQQFGIDATIAAGHSLGEIAALTWAGTLDHEQALTLARQRGALMARHGIAGGAMLRVALPHDAAARLAANHGATIACDNGADDIVLSSARATIDAIMAHCRAHGIEATPLAVSHAFHSPHMAPAIAPWRDVLNATAFSNPQRSIISTVTGTTLAPDTDIRGVLLRQLTEPVLFAAALDRIADAADIVIEVGPGQGLTRLARARSLKAWSIDAFAPSLTPLLTALAALFGAGTTPRLDVLYADRVTRAFDPDALPSFLASPCASDTRRDATPLSPPTPDEAAPPSDQPNDGDALALVRRAIAAETQFADDRFDDDDRFLDHLHLNSLSVARIVAGAARLMAIEPPRALTDFANATVRELADALAEMRALGAPPTQHDRIAGVRPWLRRYAVQWQATSQALPPAVPWQIVHLNGLNITDATDRVLLWLADGADEDCVQALLGCCQTLWRNDTVRHLAICHDGPPLSGFARSLSLEQRFDSIQIVQRVAGQSETDVLPHLSERDGFHEFAFTADGRLLAPHFLPLREQAHGDHPIDANDVVVVTGGASGIGAECALRLAERTRAAIALIGRRPADDATVRQTLERAEQMGLRCLYCAADVTNAEALLQAFADITQTFGPVTVLLHAAGRNEPHAFAKLSADDLAQTLAPKTQGLRHALAAAPDLRRVIAFGSIIGRLGLDGEAHYALANALVADIVARWAEQHPGARGLTIEWSAWSGLGMGERLGTIERLADRGVAALNVDDALDEFDRLIAEDASGTIALCGRFGASAHAAAEAAALPALRFVGEPLIHYPGVELVVETTLTPGRDLYLADHCVLDRTVLPGVIGLEAMAQAACALSGLPEPASIDDIAFDNAITVPDNAPLAIRIAALAREDGAVETVIRAADDDFATIRMRAVFAFAPLPAPPAVVQPAAADIATAPALYRNLLFQHGRFQCIAAYQHIAARRIAARLSPGDAPWFSAYEAQHLVLGDPAAHDAMLHALQAAVPHQRVLPIAIDRIRRFAGGTITRIEGREQAATDREFIFDIDAYDARGRLVEQWQGVTFRAVAALDATTALAATPQLLAPYLERVARAAFKDHSIEVAVIRNPTATRSERRSHACAALGIASPPSRGDGKPLAATGAAGLSLTHCRGVTLALKAKGPIACDLTAISDFSDRRHEPALAHTPASFVEATAHLADEPLGVAAARLWAMHESTRKLSRPPAATAKPAFDRQLGCVAFDSASARTVTIRCRCGDDDFIAAIGIAQRLLARPARTPRLASEHTVEAGAMP